MSETDESSVPVPTPDDRPSRRSPSPTRPNPVIAAIVAAVLIAAAVGAYFLIDPGAPKARAIAATTFFRAVLLGDPDTALRYVPKDVRATMDVEAFRSQLASSSTLASSVQFGQGTWSKGVYTVVISSKLSPGTSNSGTLTARAAKGMGKDFVELTFAATGVSTTSNVVELRRERGSWVVVDVYQDGKPQKMWDSVKKK